MDLFGKKILFLGDSITEGVIGVHSYENNFVNRIAKETGAICRNFGVSGTKIQNMVFQYENEAKNESFIKRVERMDDDADVIVVFGGTNDWGEGDAELGNMEDRNPHTFYGACHTLFLSLIEKYPNAEIVVLTPLHRRRENVPKADGLRHIENDCILEDYVKIIREVAEYYSLPLLDLWKCSRLQPAVPIIRDMYMPDSLHPNDAGHEIIASRIVGLLKTL
ncbi:MAG: SGNH/GDSL hydrolase family protein [Clostridia bacterium]|nr:SGNH/GDSL hydrolase family protein [Clostridia bacterium]